MFGFTSNKGNPADPALRKSSVIDRLTQEGASFSSTYQANDQPGVGYTTYTLTNDRRDTNTVISITASETLDEYPHGGGGGGGYMSGSTYTDTYTFDDKARLVKVEYNNDGPVTTHTADHFTGLVGAQVAKKAIKEIESAVKTHQSRAKEDIIPIPSSRYAGSYI